MTVHILLLYRIGSLAGMFQTTYKILKHTQIRHTKLYWRQILSKGKDTNIIKYSKTFFLLVLPAELPSPSSWRFHPNRVALSFSEMNLMPFFFGQHVKELTLKCRVQNAECRVNFAFYILHFAFF